MQRNWREQMRPKRLVGELAPVLGGAGLVGDGVRRLASTPHTDYRLALGEMFVGAGLPLLTVVASRRFNREAADYRNLEHLGAQMSHVYQNIIATSIFTDEGLVQADGLTRMFLRSAASLALADVLEEAAMQAPQSSMRDRLVFANQSAKQVIERELQVPQGIWEQYKAGMHGADFAATMGDFKSQVRGLVENVAVQSVPAASLVGVANLAVLRMRETSPKVAQATRKTLSRRTLGERLQRG